MYIRFVNLKSLVVKMSGRGKCGKINVKAKFRSSPAGLQLRIQEKE